MYTIRHAARSRHALCCHSPLLKAQSPVVARWQPFRQYSAHPAMQPKFSQGENENQLMEETKALVEEGRWNLDEEQVGVEKTYYFSNYTKCLDFAMSVGVRSKSKKHHSKMTIEYGSVHLHWTTHHPHGLSAKDTSMARYCDEQARMIGTVDKTDSAKCGPAPSKS